MTLKSDGVSRAVALVLTAGASPAAAACYTGPFPFTNNGTLTCVQVTNTSFSGNIINNTVITPGGITVTNSTIIGSIADNGTTLGGGITIDNRSMVIPGGTATAVGVSLSTFTGGISNAGVISSGGTGVSVGGVSTFGGGITNSGSISSGRIGVLVFTGSVFSGGFLNTGTISSPNSFGFIAADLSTFSGGVTNTGAITARNGLVVGFSSSSTVGTFSGGITNSGAITAARTGIGVAYVPAFSGGITNSGSITAGIGILLGPSDSTFSGAIVNSGSITGTGGVAIDVRAANNPITIDQTGGVITGAIDLSANADVLNISGGAINGDITGQGSSDTVNFALGSNTFVYSSTLSGVNNINFISGTTVLNGAIQNGSGPTSLIIAPTATLLIGSDTAVVAPAITDNGVFGFAQPGAYTFAAVISGSGKVEQVGPGATTLTAANTFSGGANLAAGTLIIGNNGALGPGALAIANGATLSFLAASNFTLANNIQITGVATITPPSGAVDTLTGAITDGSAPGTLSMGGGGTLVVSGTNTYTGGTTVTAGTLMIDGDQSASTGAISVASGATLGGIGTTGGDVSIASGGHLVGVQGQIFTMNSLTLASGSNVDVSAAAPSPIGLFNVNGNGGGPNAGNLTLAGNLNVAAIGEYGPGVYRIIDYTGALTNNGMVFGTVPPGFTPNVDLSIQTSVAHQVNLIDLRSAGPVTFWDGGNPALFNNGAVDGGNGAWLAGSASNSWTSSGGLVNTGWQSNGFPVFEVNPGTVTVDNSAGQVTFSGAQFAVDGYVITGAALTTTTADTILRVGDGTEDGAVMTATISAVIQGAGGIEKTDLGTLVLSGLNTYTGGTTITGGVLSISSDANLGDPSGGLTFNGGTLLTTAAVTSARGVTLTAAGGTIDNGGQTDLFSGAFTGPGGFISTGAGTLILTGTSTYAGPTTIAAGTLQISADANLGAPTGAVIFVGGGLHTTASIDAGRPIDVPGAGFIDTDPNTVLELDGPITGSGALTKTGAGQLLITAGGPFNGSADVGAGILAVNGNLGAAAVTVESGATLIGTGVVGTTMLKPGATIAPGPGIATLTVNGGYAQGAGSAYQVLVDPTSTRSSLISVNGAATLASGAVLNVTRTLAAPYQLGARYTVLTATGGLTGTFNVTGDTTLSAFTGLAGVYDPHDAFLVVEQNRPLTDAAVTPNQSSAAGGAQSLPTGAPLLDALVLLPNDAVARGAFNQISGEFHASIASAFIDDSRFLREAVGQRLRGEAGADQTGPHSDPGGLVSPGVWAHAFGSWGSYDPTPNAAPLDRSIGGFFMGADTLVGSDWRVGAVGGYSHSSFDVGERASSGWSNDIHLGAYAGTDWNHLSFQSGFGYTWHEVHATRIVSFPGFSDLLSSSYHAQTAQVFGEVGYRIQHDASMLEPILNLAYVHLHTDGFQESGGAAALASASHGADTVLSTLGARASTTISVNQTSHVELFGMIGWRHAFGDVTPTSTFAFAGGQPFGIDGAPIARDAAAIEAGAARRIGRSAQVGIYYSGLHANGVQDDGVRAYVSWRF